MDGVAVVAADEDERSRPFGVDRCLVGLDHDRLAIGVEAADMQISVGGVLIDVAGRTDATFPDEYLDGLRAEDRMARYTFGETGTGLITIVAVDDGILCGFATTGPAQDDDVQGPGEVYALYVDPGAWGRGSGGS